MSYVIHTTGNGPKGDTGRVGKTGGRGVKGNKGDDGKSAYEIWLDCGNTGTEQDFLDSLRGADGNDGINASIGSSITISHIYFTTSNMTTAIPFGCGNNGIACGGNFTVNGFLQVSSHTMSHTHNLAGVAAYAEDGTLVTFPTFPSGTRLSNLNGLWGLNESGAFVTNSGNSGHMVYWGTSYTLSNCSALTFNNIGASDEYIGFTKMSGEIIGAISMTASDIYASTIYTKTLYASQSIYAKTLYVSQSIVYIGSDSSAVFTYPNIATSHLITQRIGEVRESGTIIEPTHNDFSTRGSVSNSGYNISLFGNEIKIGTAYTETLAKRDTGSQAFLASNTIAQSTSVGILGDIIDIGQDQMYTIYGTNNGASYYYANRNYTLLPFSSTSFGVTPYSLMYTERHRTSAINLFASDVNIGTEPYARGSEIYMKGFRTNVNIIGLLNLLYHTTNMSIDANGFVNNNHTPIGNTLTAKFIVSSYTKREIVEHTYTTDDAEGQHEHTTLRYEDFYGNYLGIHFTYRNPNTTASSSTINSFYPLFRIDGLSHLGTVTPIEQRISLSVEQYTVTPGEFPIVIRLRQIQDGCSIKVTNSNSTVININNSDDTSSVLTQPDSFNIRIKPNPLYSFLYIDINGTRYSESEFTNDNGWYVLSNVNINRPATIKVILREQ